MLEALEKQKLSDQWQEKQFIPHPTTWLSQGRWEDEIETIHEDKPAMTLEAIEERNRNVG